MAVITDVIRDGKPVIGDGFNSNGRYGQGALMRDRFVARIAEADPDTLKVMEELGWSSRRVVPHGGHQMSLNIAAFWTSL